jgi:PadR family transcriptional regulator, regulatory protein PadR
MDLFRDFFLGFVKIHILHHAAQEPIYGLAMMEELKRHGYELSAGTLYPILHQLRAQGYLTVSQQVVKGRERKYYTITPEGRAALAEVQRKIQELGDEVLLGKGPSSIHELHS